MSSTTVSRVIDPVCGMTIDPATAAGTSVLDGTTYFFCSTSCKAKFDQEPEKYGARKAANGKSCCA